MTSRFNRLVSFGPIVVDLINHVDRIPPSGGDAKILESVTMVGGTFNVESAAARLGLHTVFAGSVGTGIYSDLVTKALAQDGIEMRGRTLENLDIGLCITLVEPNAERAFATYTGADAQLTLEQLTAVEVGPTDLVYICGYHLVWDGSKKAIMDWVTGDHANGAAIVFDPSSMIDYIDTEFLDVMRDKAFLISSNAREFDFYQPRVTDRALYLRRDGGNPVTLFENGEAKLTVDAHPVASPKDTTGAGDVHTGALMAGLAEGLGWRDAIDLANRAAAYSVTRTGGAWGPSRAQLASL
jgi:sugar/nucleoside kinase (ribokinase family)